MNEILDYPYNQSYHHHFNGTDFPGINVAGYLKTESGLGEAARGYIAALKSLNIQLALIDFSNHAPSRNQDNTLDDFSLVNPYPINLICINAAQVTCFINHVGSSYFEQKYNIGLWAWELPHFPQEWWHHFSHFDEIWVGSNFISEAISKYSPIPVVTIPHVIQTPITQTQECFDLDKNKFTFLFMFDFLSSFERKNPLAVVEAFKRSFVTDDSVQLVIKCINAEHDLANFQRLKKAIENANIVLPNKYLTKKETSELLQTCDCYISLHRSEGFGLTIAEAMSLSKPVIATAWSGNTDFMTVNNSYLVEYKLVQIPEDYGLYKQGQVWSQPNVAHAAKLMRQVYENPLEAHEKGSQAASDIQQFNSIKAIADIIKARLHVINQYPGYRNIRHELEQSQNRISAIESSGFWKLRTYWSKVKMALGL